MNFYGDRASFLIELAETQAVAGAYDEALVTVEQAVQTNPDELLHRPLALRLRGELRLRSARQHSSNSRSRTSGRLSSWRGGWRRNR